MLVWHFRDQEPFVDVFKFLSMLRGGFSFWSLICALMDKGILFLRQKKSVRLQEWQKSEIMLVWHLSLTYSLNLNLGKCAREHFKILICLLKQQTFFWKNQNLSYQKMLHCPWVCSIGCKLKTKLEPHFKYREKSQISLFVFLLLKTRQKRQNWYFCQIPPGHFPGHQTRYCRHCRPHL